MQALIGKTGKESLKRRVSEFDVDKLQLSLASKVKDLLKNYNSNEIRDTSHGAATFYVWVHPLLSRVCTLMRDIAIANLSVHPSVCPLRSGIR